MVGLDPSEILVGIDGCSAPTFAAPLQRAAHAFALIGRSTKGLPPARAAALQPNLPGDATAPRHGRRP